MNLTNDKLDIIVLAGQSNAEGNGLTNDENIETINDVYEMVDGNDYYFDFKDPNNPILTISLPIRVRVQCLQEKIGETRIASKLSLRFVELYKKSKFYDPQRKIMVVNAAVGGTGFCKKEWGLGNKLYIRLLDMVDKALSYNPENRIVAFLWHQGECDAYENANQDLEIKKNNYYNEFMNQINDFKSRYKNSTFPVIMGEFVNEWSDLPENYHSTRAIESAQYEIAKTLGNSKVASSEGLLSNNQEFQNGDNIHFSKKSLIKLAERYFDIFYELKNKQ